MAASQATQRRKIPLGPVLAAIAGATACGAATADKQASQPPLAPLPKRLTLATLAGPLCGPQRCECDPAADDLGISSPSSPLARSDAAIEVGPGLPEQHGLKRYQIKLGPVANELWLKVDDMVLYKSSERSTACFYVDLHAGKHPLTLQVQGAPSFAARLSISEIGAAGRYDTFAFACGGPSQCDLAQLKRWQRSLAKYRRKVHDPCGSTKIRDINWQTGLAPDGMHPDALQLDLVLDVYSFVPKHPPGHPACADKY